MRRQIENNERSAHEARFIRTKVPLASYTTFRIGGDAAYFAEVTNINELREALLFAHTQQLKYFILGGGSNLLVADEGFDGLIIHVAMRGIAHTVLNDCAFVTIGAGEKLDDVVAYAGKRSLWGIENLSAIPGTIGGAAVQNAGAYGVELSNVIDSVEVYDMHEECVRIVSQQECAYGYRESTFKTKIGGRYVVMQVTLALSLAPMPQLSYKDLAVRFPEQTATLADIRKAVIAVRAAKFPDLTQYGTAGSFFKNPIVAAATYATVQETYEAMPGYATEDDAVKIPIAWILDHVLHLRGVREGAVGAWEAQPLVLTNYGHATATEVDAFAKKIVHAVRECVGIDIEREVITVHS